MPTIRPKVAPTAMEGTKMPAGTLAPYEMMMSAIRKTVARRRELTIRHCAHVLPPPAVSTEERKGEESALAEPVVVPILGFALAEKDVQ